MRCNKYVKRINIALFLILLATLFLPNNSSSYNKSWDQGHLVCVVEPGTSNWGKFDASGVFHGGYSSKECCDLLCKVCSVYANTGRLQKTFTDLTVPGIGPALTITRTYDSQEWANSLLGYGWIFNFGKQLIITRNNDGDKIVGVRLETGEKNFYKEYPDDTLERLTDYGATYDLIKNADNTYTIKNRDGSRHELRENGKIAKIIDQNNNELVFTYNSVGCLTRITNASGNYVDLLLGPNGKIASISDNLGRTISYGYDENGNLISVTDPMGNTTQYVYNSDNLLTQIIDARGNVVESATYDNNQPPRVATFTEKGETYTIAYYNGYTVKTDSSGNAWTSYFNDVGVITKVIDPLGNVKEQQLNKITATSVDWEEDLNGNRTTYTYDADGNIAGKTDPLGNTTTYTYVAGTNLVETETDPLGHVTKYEYDANGNQTKIIRDFGGTLENTITYTYDIKGNQISVTDPNGNTTSYEYDANGNLTKVTDPLGNVTIYTYDSRGNNLTGTDANGNTTTYAYDLMDRLVSVADALGNTTTYTYDANGNLLSQTDANGNTITFTYDAYNRLTQETDPLGNTTSYTYDSRDNLISMTDANGNTTTYTYNALDQLIAETNALGNATSYTYDGNGNRLTITDANGNTTINTYDALNRMITTTYPGGTFETFSYNADGNLIARTDRNGNTINNTYDSLHRLTVKTYPDGTTMNYTYDFNGNILTDSNPDVSYAFTYDALNRVTQVTNVTIDKPVSYSYFWGSLKSSMTDTEGGVTRYEYNKIYLLTKVTDSSGRVTTYNYDGLGRLIEKVLPNGIRSIYNYDTIGRLLSLENKNTSIISKFDYTYDNLVHRTSMTTLEGTHNYTYDKIYQLIQATHPALDTETYTYDAIGNRLTSADYSNWNYDSNNRLLSYGDTIFTYDNNGNTLTQTNSAGTTTYIWDYENKLIQVNLPDSEIIRYGYDPFGRRISKSVNSIRSNYLYDGEDIIAEYDITGSLLVKYVQGQGVDEPISMEKGSNIYYFTFDGQGSVSELINSSGEVIQSYKYDSFGNIVEQTGTINNPYTFTGREYDADISLYYYRARYYNHSLGRFLTIDPIKFKGGINFYIYVKNNPISFTDPFGLRICVASPKDNNPNAATIVCDGAGGIKVQSGWASGRHKCIKGCVTAHENVHKNDCLKATPNVCKGQLSGTRVNMSEAKDSECRSYKTESTCLKNSQKTKECCGRKDVENRITFIDGTQIPTYCN